jgi:nitric oxide reductase subunit B
VRSLAGGFVIHQQVTGTRDMKSTRKLWLLLAIVTFVSFIGLGLLGRDIYRAAPPVPAQVVTDEGAVIFTEADIQMGREVWQSMGGMQVGSIWGHGAYLAPDWSADWLHREATLLLDRWAAQRYQAASYEALSAEPQAGLKARLKEELRTNRYDADSGRLTVSAERAAVIGELAGYYKAQFGAEPSLDERREQYAMPNNPIPDAARREALTAFFFWAAWATETDRPGETGTTYTSNWPHEPLIDNVPTTSAVVWSVVSVVMLILAIGLLVWYNAATHQDERNPNPPASDPLAALKPTPSMLATRKYFFTVIALWLAQIGLGILTAHYTVEGHALFGIPLADILPYAVTRTWHIQIAIFWIATAWLATGLYIAPALSGVEPRFQKFGVNLLYGALLFLVVGSLFGEWLAVQQIMPLDLNFWLGHQGYEYVDLGRAWQWVLFAGLLIWLTLVGRALWPTLRRPGENRALVAMLFLSTVAIALFYAAGLTWGKHTSLSVIEYWRWWVVHLWVEGFFEVFATAVIALLFVKLGLVRARIATTAVLFATSVFLLGGILGTLHHLYWAGTPTSVLAVGAVISALEVVPLVLLGYEGWQHYKLSSATPWVAAYKWPIIFFVSVAFWNMLGAGVFGFLVNPPISLYYIQGLNLTAVHSHSALFGVYGMLGIGLMLFCLRGLSVRAAWDDRLLKGAFWTLNGGLLAMVVFSLLPVGAIQAWVAVDQGLWAARSHELLHSPLIETLIWMRVPGDTAFSLGAALIALFAWRLWRGGGSVGERIGTEAPSPVAAE